MTDSAGSKGDIIFGCGVSLLLQKFPGLNDFYARNLHVRALRLQLCQPVGGELAFVHYFIKR
ncbi:MAG: hypothetical protein JXM70_18570 [Pirellulales bacterium]|nr:hypothetical protein [Pirellulales bacterium]